jgi:hypothetical protein
MEPQVKLSFWSDEDRWFVPRAFGLGYSLNLKYVAKRFGWIKPSGKEAPVNERSESGRPTVAPKTREQRLREQIESSKYEDVR